MVERMLVVEESADRSLMVDLLMNHVCGLAHLKDPLQLIGNNSPCNGGSGFPLSVSEWFPRHITVNMLIASLN